MDSLIIRFYNVRFQLFISLILPLKDLDLFQVLPTS